MLWHTVRNSARSAVPYRDNIVPYMSSMFDPCSETRKLGAGPAEGANVTSAVRQGRSKDSGTRDQLGMPPRW